jgi:hypothetical protein
VRRDLRFRREHLALRASGTRRCIRSPGGARGRMMAPRRKPAEARKAAAGRSGKPNEREARFPPAPPDEPCNSVKAPRKRRPRFVL